MVLLMRGLPVLIEIGLLVFCLIEVIQTPGDEVRNLPKGVWILLVLFVPIIGPIAWLVAGRPNTRRMSEWRVGNGFPEHERPRAASASRVAAPDDDPEFLRTWEADLRAREAKLRREKQDPEEPGSPS